MQISSLTKKQDFAKISKTGVKAVSKSCVILALKANQLNNDGPQTKIGYIVSKKLGNAICRNRIKRRLKAAMGQIYIKGSLTEGNYVVIGRQLALKRRYSNIIQDIEYCLANILKQS